MAYNIPAHTKGDTFLSPIFEVIVNGTAVDLDEYSIKMQVRRYAVKTSPVVIEFSKTDGTMEVVGASTDGKFKIKEAVVDIPANTYKYDIEFTKISTEKVRTWIKGEWQITEEVTQ